MGNISKIEAQNNRNIISKLLNQGLSHDQIIEQLKIDRSTFYRYLKQMRDIETEIWSKVEIDSARYRGLALLRSFEDTVRICTTIAQSNNVSNKDRIEACKARDIANAHILRLVSEGTMFRHLPEVHAYDSSISNNSSNIDNNNIINNNKELEYNSNTDNDNDLDSSSDSDISNDVDEVQAD